MNTQYKVFDNIAVLVVRQVIQSLIYSGVIAAALFLVILSVAIMGVSVAEHKIRLLDANRDTDVEKSIIVLPETENNIQLPLDQRRFETGQSPVVKSSLGQSQAEFLNGIKIEVDIMETMISTSASNSDECCICYDIIGSKNCCVTDCGHAFCLKCLATSVRKNIACPICRTNIVDDEDEDMEDDDEGDEYEEDDEDEEEDDEDDEFLDIEQVEGTIEEYAERMLKNGITYKDLIAINIGVCCFKMNMNEMQEKQDTFYQIIEDIDSECREKHLMNEEDPVEKCREQVGVLVKEMVRIVDMNSL